ncbi:MAG: hypothetical protein MUF23_18570 [Pirellula sp.]|nr:hypothetical protein [Pirellula sp.]
MNCMLQRWIPLWLVFSMGTHVFALAQEKRELATAVAPGVRLERIVEAPDIVTPTGIDVDVDGNLYVIACHTHFRPASYEGPGADEVLVFDANGKGRRVFYNRTKTTMQVRCGPDGWVYLAQRDRILRVRDTDNDGIADTEEPLATLDTITDYPHNGLSGLAWHPDGDLLFSLGENFGKDWILTAQDGSEVRGRGEGGVFRCTKDGRSLRRIARGFWNPFGMLARKDGLILAADNDPGDRPPCRLLHVVEGADFGFQYVYGNAPIHPFVAWNGELRGTLGMVTACGEGPCAVVELGGGVLIPSWSDRTIDYYPLHWNGASLTSERQLIVEGNDSFRPVGMVQASPNQYFIADWGSESYEVNGLGRIWKMTIDPALADWIQAEGDAENDAVRLANQLRDGTVAPSMEQLLDWIRGEDRYLADAALHALALQMSASHSKDDLYRVLSERPARDRAWALVALRRIHFENPEWVKRFWNDPDPEVRFECLRWISDAVFIDFLDEAESLLHQTGLSYPLFEAAVATVNTLKGNPSAGITDAEYWLTRVLDPNASEALTRYALRLIPANHPKLTSDWLFQRVKDAGPELATELVRTLALQKSESASDQLLEVASNQLLPDQLRADALAGLCGLYEARHEEAIQKLQKDIFPVVRQEAKRVLRVRSQQAPNPVKDVTEMIRTLDQTSAPGDVFAGRRLFFHTGAISCSQCHRYQGRGGVVGPDLTFIARQGTRDQILRSIMEPNHDVAPQYYATLLELDDGGTFTGILLRSAGYEVYRDAQGKEVVFQKDQIVSRKQLRSSLMPHGLIEFLTVEELRDLLAFLTTDPE